MRKESMEIALIKYNKKTWSKSALLGFFVGLAVIVPGISGSTVAIIFKLYDQFLYAIGNLFRKFKKCFVFLLPIVLGMLVGVLIGFISVKKLLELIPFAVVCLFAGLMIGAFPAVKDEIKDAKMNAKRIALFIVGLLIPIGLGCFSAITVAKGDAESADKFLDVEWWHFVLAMAIGYVVGVTQIVPGLSASAFLMAVGWFGSLMESVSMTYWEANSSVFLVYGGLALGFLVGLFTFSKFLTHIFGKARHTAYSMIVGLSLGSIVSMFCNGDIMETYLAWKRSGVEWLDLALGLALLAVGVVIAYLLVRYERKKSTEEKQNEKNI